MIIIVNAEIEAHVHFTTEISHDKRLLLENDTLGNLRPAIIGWLTEQYKGMGRMFRTLPVGNHTEIVELNIDLEIKEGIPLVSKFKTPISMSSKRFVVLNNIESTRLSIYEDAVKWITKYFSD